ncbi:MAG: hypothetical protein KME59_10730 [Trichormus sp. ATA11-4-KO1]|jgi:hypothetical protein|nr:hypothetical protein [Trichormus sp. ATA11-4-KO1]
MSGEQCPKCDSSRTQYDDYFGFWECDDCGYVWSEDEDDPDYDEESLDLGTCCSCGCTGETVRNIITLEKKAPVPGTGWGCLVCGLPSDGAITVVCDDCLALMDRRQDVIKEVVYGYATEKKRYSINGLTEEFKHKNIPH